MLGFLFRGLTAEPARGEALFAALTAEARRRAWYVEGQVPDTIDGRFAVLSTVCALALVRLEQEGEAGDKASIALTERFIAVMESEHRELGLGDPALGRTVRKLVGMLARRTELWRATVAGGADRAAATRDSLNQEDESGEAEAMLKRLWQRLAATSVTELQQGIVE
jgi:cytochrome b pre-mRNA-processing protein 3